MNKSYELTFHCTNEVLASVNVNLFYNNLY